MAIWIWILAAWVLSYLAIGKNKVRFEHLIWILLPVDMYGISIVGATIKPYMIFCSVLFVRMLICGDLQFHTSKWLAGAGILTGAVVIVNIANNTTGSAPKAALLLVIVWLCCCIYVSSCNERTWTDIPNVLVATGIGYGIVFILLYIFLEMQVKLPGLVTTDRTLEGIFLRTSNYYENALIQTNRLRGFTIDPNTTIGVFALCSIVCFLRLTDGKGTKKEWCGIAVSAICVLLTGSRMGILCFVLLFVLTLIAGYRIANIRVRNYMKLILLALLFIVIFLLIVTNVIQGFIGDLLASYDNRSGLTDEYGRFSIWKNAISVWLENNPLLGIGMGQMRYYTATGRDCHNTWLSMVCENGLVVGCSLCLLFAIAAVIGINKTRMMPEKSRKELSLGLVLGFFTIMLSLVSVDNMTYSYLWLCAALLTAI